MSTPRPPSVDSSLTYIAEASGANAAEIHTRLCADAARFFADGIPVPLGNATVKAVTKADGSVCYRATRTYGQRRATS